VSELTAKILHKDPRVTAIIVKSADAADWFAGGKSLAEQKLASYWLDIHITEGTNTKDEKAAYLAALFQRMGELLGPLHNESYAHVDEVGGDAYGFGGLTQERRYIRRQARGGAAEGGLSPTSSLPAGAPRCLPNTSPNACRSAMSTSAMVTAGRDRPAK